MAEPFKSFEEMAEHLAKGGRVTAMRLDGERAVHGLVDIIKGGCYVPIHWRPYTPKPRTFQGLEGVQAMVDKPGLKLKDNAGYTLMVDDKGELMAEWNLGWMRYPGSVAVLAESTWTEVLP